MIQRGISFAIAALLAIGCGASLCAAAETDAFEIDLKNDRLLITRAGKPVASYVFQDEKIPRPYFCDIYAPGGARVTRNHPPIEGQDLTDHELLHPGIWLSFGDLGGADFWRLKAKTQHVKFERSPQVKDQAVTWQVHNRYLDGARAVCDEVCEMTITLLPEGYLFSWDSTFQSPDGPFAFGDQDEMGLGIRMHTPLSVAQGGAILNSDGLKDEKQAWGKPADWCMYHGKHSGDDVGVLLMPSAKNFRRAWFHCRDYGLVAANPFGKNAFTGGEKSRIEVPAGKPFALAYRMLIFQRADEPLDPAASYQKYGR